MKILLIDNGTSLLQKLQNLLPKSEITRKWDAPLYDMNSFDLIILSGSRDHCVLRDHNKFANEISLIKSSQKPIIGICFGCELIAYAFAGELKKLDTPHQGIREIEIDQSISRNKIIKVYEHHRWIISNMPKHFNILAKSKDGPEAIKHETLSIYGLQFHPENFVEETEGDEIFLNLIKKIAS